MSTGRERGDGRTGHQILEAELTWDPDADGGAGALREGLRLALDGEGRIVALGGPEAIPGEPTRRLPRRALLPGFVNAHSHAFQRGLRGRGETFPAGAGSFWTWRQAMYGLVDELTPSAFRALCVQAFEEMRDAGITTVGEFHYLHHRRPGPGGAADYGLDELVLEAAAQVGLRIVLLQAFYASGGIGRPLEPAQHRFRSESLEAYWRQMDRLEARLDPATQSLGVVAHSIRAASPEQIAELWQEAVRRGLPFHMHLEEQDQEVEDCLGAYGREPIPVTLDALDASIGPEPADPGAGEAPGRQDVLPVPFTAVHATQTAEAHLHRLLRAGGHIALCPTTEANLGDGLPDLGVMLAVRPEALCLGTDSNARISMLEEARWLELAHRAVRRERGVLRDDRGRVAPRLLAMATGNGARSLAVHAGRLAPGAWGDLVTVDLDHPQLAGASAETLLEALFLGAADEVLAETAVAGRWRSRRSRP